VCGYPADSPLEGNFSAEPLPPNSWPHLDVDWGLVHEPALALDFVLPYEDLAATSSLLECNTLSFPAPDIATSQMNFIDLPDFTTASTTSTPPNRSDESEISLEHAGVSRGQKRPPPPTDAEAALKRQRNTLAARKYRQKRLDRIKELEDALENMTRERDDLKLRLARQEAETAVLKEMMRLKPT